MIPFHKLYSLIFKSFDVESETETIQHLIKDGVTRVLIIKRSWIFALMLIWIPILIVLTAGANIYTALYYHEDKLTQYGLILGVGISVILFGFSVINYIVHFRKVYNTPTVRTDFKELLGELEVGDKYFSRFFDQTVLNQIILFGLIIASGLSYISHMRESWSLIIWADVLLLFIQWFLLSRYRKRMIDMEMDYNIVIPGKIMFINQSGMLSSVNTVEGDKVKTVSAKYAGWFGSFFNFGNIEIMTEGDNISMTGTMPMYYVTAPNETGRLIQSMLNRELTNEPLIPIAPSLPADVKKPTHTPKNTQQTPSQSPQKTTKPTQSVPVSPESKIGTSEVGYDVRGTVRSILK